MGSKIILSRLQPKNFVRPAIITGVILIIPLVATNSVNGFNWGPGDFVGMGAFIYIFGLIFEVAMVKLPKYKIPAAMIILIVFLFLYGVMATTD